MENHSKIVREIEENLIKMNFDFNIAIINEMSFIQKLNLINNIRKLLSFRENESSFRKRVSKS
jgi:hypothetical protein